ncbi:hypothetical protein BJ508DRAFT_311025 [Ascobolus immersus RN42]|uniref:Uncharacterized protein n=1 Tax=Ascobolus immersus RN42 TaxID=1160509 RepID=A0A3N4HT94_ASCIM|nr:hypothetical protein BJ508DRAFT_311025 [Ascobolus immersus RN42]
MAPPSPKGPEPYHITLRPGHIRSIRFVHPTKFPQQPMRAVVCEADDESDDETLQQTHKESSIDKALVLRADSAVRYREIANSLCRLLDATEPIDLREVAQNYDIGCDSFRECQSDDDCSADSSFDFDDLEDAREGFLEFVQAIAAGIPLPSDDFSDVAESDDEEASIVGSTDDECGTDMDG